jgi:putative transposase
MAHTFTSLHAHLIFSTKERKPFLTSELRDRLFPYMGGIIREMKGVALIVNGVEDHVHILAGMPSTIAVSDFMRDLKSNSSSGVKETFAAHRDFGWQTGYAAFNVSKSAIEDVRTYIARQEEHHCRMSFKEELIALLKKHEITYDERFVFD